MLLNAPVLGLMGRASQELDSAPCWFCTTPVLPVRQGRCVGCGPLPRHRRLWAYVWVRNLAAQGCKHLCHGGTGLLWAPVLFGCNCCQPSVTNNKKKAIYNSSGSIASMRLWVFCFVGCFFHFLYKNTVRRKAVTFSISFSIFLVHTKMK